MRVDGVKHFSAFKILTCSALLFIGQAIPFSVFAQDLRLNLQDRIAPAPAMIDAFVTTMNHRIMRVAEKMTQGTSPLFSQDFLDDMKMILHMGIVKTEMSETSHTVLRPGDAPMLDVMPASTNRVSFFIPSEVRLLVPSTFMDTWTCEEQESEIAHDIRHLKDVIDRNVPREVLEDTVCKHPFEVPATYAQVWYYAGYCEESSSDSYLGDLAELFKRGETESLHDLLAMHTPCEKTKDQIKSLSFMNPEDFAKNYEFLISMMTQINDSARDAQSEEELMMSYAKIRACESLREQKREELQAGIKKAREKERAGELPHGTVLRIRRELAPRYNDAYLEQQKLKKLVWSELLDRI